MSSVLLAAGLSMLTGACSDAATSGTAEGSAAAGPDVVYSLEATRQCLAGQVESGPIAPDDERLTELADLSQHDSLQAGVGSSRVALAVKPSPHDAHLLADLLTVPDDTYRLVVNANAVLLHPPSADATATTVITCLRADVGGRAGG